MKSKLLKIVAPALLLAAPYTALAEEETPEWARVHTGGALVLASDAGLDPGTCSTLVTLATHRLTEDGVQLVDSPSLHGSRALDMALASQLRAIGTQRLFILRVGRLGQKFVFQLDERDPTFQHVVATASLSGVIEDADRILPRLVDAVIRHQPVDDTATLSTLTSEEGRDYNTRPGIGHFVLGLPLGFANVGANGSAGLSLGFLYEAEKWGFGFDTEFAVSGNGSLVGDIDIFGDYFFKSGFWSPYVGLGLGYVGIGLSEGSGWNESVSGAGARPEVGVELFRLNHMRLRISAQAVLPFVAPTDGSSYLAAALLHAQIAF